MRHFLLTASIVFVLIVPSSAAFADTFTTFDPANKGANVDLSGGNLIATKNNSAWQGTRSVLSVPASTQCYWETTINSGFGGGAAPGTGIGNGSATVSNYVWIDTNGWALNPVAGSSGSGTGKATNNSTVAYGGKTFSNGDTFGTYFDSGTGNLGFIANDGTDMGVAFSGLAADTYYAYVSMFGTGANWTANFGATAFAHTPPTGYSACLKTSPVVTVSSRGIETLYGWE